MFITIKFAEYSSQTLTTFSTQDRTCPKLLFMAIFTQHPKKLLKIMSSGSSKTVRLILFKHDEFNRDLTVNGC